MANENKEIKVTDKRMFTSDGELREEYRFLDEKSTADGRPRAAAERRPGAPRARPHPGAGEPRARQPRRSEAPADCPPDLPGAWAAPSFFDLVAMLAEPVPIYLGDAGCRTGSRRTNLEMARLHIDLLDVLRQKTAGNLTAQESAFLEDLLYRLRVRYVQKTGIASTLTAAARGLALALLLALPAPAAAGGRAVSSPQVTGVEMTAPVRQTLKQLEEQWLQWVVQNNRAAGGPRGGRPAEHRPPARDGAPAGPLRRRRGPGGAGGAAEGFRPRPLGPRGAPSGSIPAARRRPSPRPRCDSGWRGAGWAAAALA